MATPKAPVNLVLGTGLVGDRATDPMVRFDTPEEINAVLDVFSKRGYHQIDTACTYSSHAPGSCEPRLGAVAAGDRFIIDSKVNSWMPGSHTKEKILKDINTSLEALKVNQMNIEYLHVPDRETPFEEACEAMDQAVREGKIKQWGVCNHPAAEVQKLVDICEKRGFAKPSVYQGQYNPIARSNEKELFPLLRKNGIAFYAFSPAAAGFFTGHYKTVKPGDRFDSSLFAGAFYNNCYLKPSIIAATDKVLEIAAKHGLSGHAAAIRWTAHHSMLSKTSGDSMVLGYSSAKQLESTIDMIEQGPLPDDVVAALGALYGEIGAEDEIPYHV